MMKAGMRDVDDVEHAERDRDADRHGRVEAAEQQARDDGVEQKVHGNAHARPHLSAAGCPRRLCGASDNLVTGTAVLPRCCVFCGALIIFVHAIVQQARQLGYPALHSNHQVWPEQMNSPARRALVVGGSMSGLFSALYLRRRGWDVDVYERSSAPLTGRGAGIMTHPELRSALTDLGLDTTQNFGVPIEGRVVLDAAGNVIARKCMAADRDLVEPPIRNADGRHRLRRIATSGKICSGCRKTTTA